MSNVLTQELVQIILDYQKAIRNLDKYIHKATRKDLSKSALKKYFRLEFDGLLHKNLSHFVALPQKPEDGPSKRS